MIPVKEYTKRELRAIFSNPEINVNDRAELDAAKLQYRKKFRTIVDPVVKNHCAGIISFEEYKRLKIVPAKVVQILFQKILYTVVILLLLSFQNSENYGVAQVQKYSGIYVFFNCTPVNEYEHLATVKKMVIANSISDGAQYAALAKRDYPTCDAIIFRDMKLGFNKDEFEVVRFER